MNISSVGSQLLSKLGSPDSKIPLAAKDIFNCAGYTYFSYDAGGKVEGKDRLVDELGTGLLWLFGIPTYKKIIDKTIFKKAGISSEIDVRVLKNPDYLKTALKNSPDEKILSELTKAAENIKKTKQLNMLKFVMALGLTMVSYFALTKFKHNMTKKNIEKEFLQNQEKEKTNTPYDKLNLQSPKVFEEFKKPNNNPSFKSGALISVAEDFMFNPVKNMFLLDMGISSERLSEARTEGEFKEYALKEGSFLFFVYGAGKLINKGIEKLSELIKHPVGLDAKVLSSDIANDILNKKELQQEIKDFGSKFIKNENANELYNFIFKNPDNIVVEAAKKSGIVSTVKTSDGITKIDPRKYIDPKKMEKLAKNLDSFITAGKSSSNMGKYLNRVKGMKIGATILNVAICCFALGYIVPKKMYELRQKNQNGKNDFHVKTEYEKELKEKYQQKSDIN